VTFTVTAWNIRQGGGDRAQRIVEALEHLGTDIAVLGEWRATSPNRIAHRLAAAGYEHQIGEPDPAGGYAGLLVASKRPIRSGAIVYDDPTDGHRFQHVEVIGTLWVIGAAYIPGHEQDTDRKRRYWDFIVNSWAPRTAQPALLCGDLNTGLHYRDELGATLQCHDRHSQLEASGWRDAWIERNPRRRPPGTWFSPKYDNPFRLDHAILSPTAPRARRTDYPATIAGQAVLGQGGLSDHLPVVVQL
jgi:exonuclease III